MANKKLNSFIFPSTPQSMQAAGTTTNDFASQDDLRCFVQRISHTGPDNAQSSMIGASVYNDGLHWQMMTAGQWMQLQLDTWPLGHSDKTIRLHKELTDPLYVDILQ